MTAPVRLAISLGDPGGVGPETAARAIVAMADSPLEFELHCSRSLFSESCSRFRWAGEILALADSGGKIEFTGAPDFAGKAPAGRPTPRGGVFAYESFLSAMRSVVDGNADALVTMPLSKAGVESSGVDFRGHTEVLRDTTGASRVVMMLQAGDLRVVPLTRHVALREVPYLITEELIRESVEIIAGHLGKFEKMDNPAIAIMGLNPHCGEDGLFGDEEKQITRAVESLRTGGYNITGPLVPDTALIPANLRRFDVFVGMYHDQVLVPLKMGGFDRSVNATLGLPIIRTSPGHGTAYDIAGSECVSETSALEAMKLAARWAKVSAEG